MGKWPCTCPWRATSRPPVTPYFFARSCFAARCWCEGSTRLPPREAPPWLAPAGPPLAFCFGPCTDDPREGVPGSSFIFFAMPIPFRLLWVHARVVRRRHVRVCRNLVHEVL